MTRVPNAAQREGTQTSLRSLRKLEYAKRCTADLIRDTSVCSMTITQEVRDYAATLNEKEAGMAETSE